MKHPIRIGTSGWHYDHWQGPFYPEAGVDDRLAYYAERFGAVEINNTFYRLPEAETLRRWCGSVGEDFRFAVKASRYVTHLKKLNDPAEAPRRFFDRIEALGERRGPVLFQLPPRWGVNPERLEGFLEHLPEMPAAFEFRDESWWTEEIYDLLRRHDAAFCQYQLAGRETPEVITAELVYVRLHGPEEERYEGRYDGDTLDRWARRLATWAGDGHRVWCFFDNDQGGHAAEDARRLAERVSGAGS